MACRSAGCEANARENQADSSHHHHSKTRHRQNEEDTCCWAFNKLEALRQYPCDKERNAPSEEACYQRCGCCCALPCEALHPSIITGDTHGPAGGGFECNGQGRCRCRRRHRSHAFENRECVCHPATFLFREYTASAREIPANSVAECHTIACCESAVVCGSTRASLIHRSKKVLIARLTRDSIRIRGVDLFVPGSLRRR